MASADSLVRRLVRTDHPARADTPAGREAASPARERTLRTFFHAHHASIWRLLRRFGVPQSELDDAVQQVFWVAARRFDEIRAGRERAFLYGVSLRVASNVLRRERVQPQKLELAELDELAHADPSPEGALEEREARALLDVVLGRLPVELRTIFVLFEIESMPLKDIAELEEIPVGTVNSRLRRAREEFSAITKRMRAALAARGGIGR